MNRMKTECWTEARAFDALESEWNVLLRQSASDTIFLTPEWQKTWWRTLGEGDLCVITFRDDAGALVGIAPLFRKNGALALVGCVEVSDYLDVIIARGREDAVYRALLDVLLDPSFPAWNKLTLCNLPDASTTPTQLKTLAEARGLRAQAREEDVAPYIELPATWGAYLESLDKKQRHELRRKLRRIGEVEHRWEKVNRAAQIPVAVSDFIALHKKSRPDKNMFMDARMQDFFLAIAEVMQARGWLELAFLEIQTVRAAALWGFVYNDDVLVYNSGYDPENYRAASPGVALFAYSLQDAIAARRRRYDFLQGNEEYKYRLGARDARVWTLHVTR